jgi:hypothetical protein
MKEEITADDITIEVLGFFYKIPYYVLAEDEDIRDMYDLYDENPSTGGRSAATQLMEWITIEQQADLKQLAFIRGMVALKPQEYCSYRYVKLNEHDYPREAMLAYVKQFQPEDSITALKRELAFFAGIEWKQFMKPDPVQQFFEAMKAFFGGLPATLTFEVPDGKMWRCSHHVYEIFRRNITEEQLATVGTDPPSPNNATAVRPVSTFIFGSVTINIKDKIV